MALFSIFFWLIASCYAVFSYALTAPNLVLSSWPPYWQFQTWMWATFFDNRPRLSVFYLGIILVWWAIYLAWIWFSRRWSVGNRTWLIGWLLVVAPLLGANNALSYDVFNYIFNAKMVVVYHANPHVKFALEYAQDDWTRFMHNTHTPAPYGYGWTAFSLIPYLVGGGKFVTTWLVFRLWSLVSFLLLIAVSWWGITWLIPLANQPQAKRWLSWVIFNPLLLIEIITNSHNDLWMLVPAMASLLLVGKPKVRRWQWWWVPLSIVLLAISISFKLVTVVLVPLWLVLVVWHLSSHFRLNWPWSRYHLLTKLKRWLLNWLTHWPLIASVFLFVPLLTPRSQQFHPWYLSWVLVWLPLVNPQQHPWKSWVWFSFILSLTSLLRYLPYLWAGEHSPQVLLQQQLITWSALPICIILWLGHQLWRRLA